MVKFLNTSKAYAEIEDIVNKARNKLVLISPYIKIPEPLYERLKYADGKSVKITVVCRKDDLKADVRNELEQLKNLELRFLESLHAKCFFNEESMVITSLNLHEYSQQHNREMGVLLRLKADQDIFREAQAEAEFIVNSAEEYKLRRPVLSGAAKMAKSLLDSAIKDEPKRPKSSSYSYKPRTRQKGSCIRCGANIRHDLDKPYCPDCFSEWSVYENPDYEESRCHTCGRRARTTIEKPQCRSCYNKSPR
jgi:hypothetical protein